MNRRSSLLILVALAVIIVGAFFFAQRNNEEPSRELKTIGVVQHTKGLDLVYEGLKKGMAGLGYREGVDIVFEYQFSEGNPDRVREITREYLAKDVDLIFAITSSAVREVVKETKAANRDDLPVVFTNGVTVLEDGVVASYQSSGNNTTGLIPDDTAISVKKLEFLTQINPAAKRVGVFISPNPVSAKEKTLSALEDKGRLLGISVVRYEIPVDAATRTADAGARQVAGTIKHGDIDAIMTIPDPVVTTPAVSGILAELGMREKIPTLFLNIVDGGLLAYNLDLVASGEQAAVMVDKIFSGTLPKDIPIEFPEKNVLIIDTRTARDIGVTIPDSLIRIADQVLR